MASTSTSTSTSTSSDSGGGGAGEDFVQPLMIEVEGGVKMYPLSITGEERLGRPFVYTLEIISLDELETEGLIGKNATVRILGSTAGETSAERYVNGYIVSVQHVTSDRAEHRYELELAAWPWFLSRTTDCRQWQGMTSVEIAVSLFREAGFSDFEDKLTKPQATREFCVQYNETTLDFVSRLFEREGVYYYFRHENGRHTMVLCDDPTSHESAELAAAVPFLKESNEEETDSMTSWRARWTASPKRFEVNDFDFKKPTTPVNGALSQDAPGDVGEMYEYPGAYTEQADGDRLAAVRLAEQRWRREVYAGDCGTLSMTAGCVFTLSEHPHAAFNTAYMATAVAIHAESPGPWADRAAGQGRPFRCSVTAVKSKVVFKPERLTPRPVIAGPQTAIVVGKKDSEITADEFGRVRVKFHWDRLASADDTASCWVRVSQAWAGKGWGGLSTPRVGQEVIVEFLEGDPERPIITGRVYNGQQKPPYSPKEFPTITGMKTNTSPKDEKGFNELRFEDKAGEEQVFVHAQRNMDVRVLNDRFETVLNNRHLGVANDKFEKVEHDRHEIVKNDHFEEIGKDRHLTVKGFGATLIEGDLSLQVDGNVAEKFGQDHSEETTGALSVLGADVVIEGKTNITLKVGGSKIAIDSTGIKIEAPQVVIKAQTMLEASGATAKVEGQGVLTLKGGVVMIN